MRLSLTIVGTQAGALVSSAEVQWVDHGGTIGRGQNNDWVLPDHGQTISRHHATVHFVNGGFYLEDTSTNGVCVNQPDALLIAGELHWLTDRQLLYLGPYQIVVRVDPVSSPPDGADDTVVPPANLSAHGGGLSSPLALPASVQHRNRPGIPATEPADAQALTRLLRAAGLRPDRVTPAAAEEIGRVLRTAVQGIVDLMRARAAFYKDLRLPPTLIAAGDNNPLQLSTKAEDALHDLLVGNNPEYADAAQAFEAAFADLHIHQEAIMAGLRQTFSAMLDCFDPQLLEPQLDDQKGHRSGSSRTPGRRVWGLYKEYFEATRADTDVCFQRLFGEAFVRAYEDRVERGDQRRRGQAET